MSIITSISISNDDWDYLRTKKLSPTRLFKIGLERSRNVMLVSPEDVSTENIIQLNKKIEMMKEALKLLDERAQRAEHQLKIYQNFKNEMEV